MDGKSVKSKVKYLGTVIDSDKGMYRNRVRGTFTYALDTGEYEVLDWEDVPSPEQGAPSSNLDFGDGYLLHGVMDETLMTECIEAMGTGVESTIAALVEYYVLTDRMGMCNTLDWYIGNYASILYPNADLRSQRISDALMVMGNGQFYRCFFKAYLEKVADARNQLIAVDSKGVLNAIDIGMTEASNHNR